MHEAEDMPIRRKTSSVKSGGDILDMAEADAGAGVFIPALHVDIEALAHALGGAVIGDGQIMCPGPDHSASDRSLSVLITPDAPDGFVVNSFAGDGWVRCKDYVEAAICDLPKGEQRVFADRPRSSSSPKDRKSWHVGKAFYEESIPVSGTIAETYLRWRGLTLPLASTGLCLAPPHLWSRRTAGEHSPAMLARMVDVEDQPTAFHFTYLRKDGRWKIDTKPDRKVFGLAKGGVIRLGPVAEELLITEGIETALTAMQEMGQTAWAAYSAGNLEVLELPPAVRSVIIFPDGDERGTSQKAAASAADRWRGEGRKVRVAKAPVRPGFKGTDLNDLLMERLGLRRPPPPRVEVM